MVVESQDATGLRRTDVLVGLRDGLPVFLGTLPYGLVVGVTAASAGLSGSHALGLSALVYAGLAQLTVIDLLDRGTPLIVVVVTALIINARFAMYSASIAPHLEELSLGWRVSCPFLLVGPVYGIALSSFEENCPTHHEWYFLGVALPSWMAWIGATFAGVTLGTQVPEGWSFDFVVPLLFIAIVVQFVQSRATSVAALVSGGSSLLVLDVPLNLGFLLASGIGVIVGLGFEWSQS